MDFESPDVEKDFPGLYASESGRKSNESDFSDGGDHDKPSKKGLLGRQKDKKESKKDRGYAALEGESSPEEDTDTKSPSKSKKTKSFKFPTKSKEKREKSRDKEKVLEEAVKQQQSEKEKKKEKEKEKKEKEKKEKLKEKDKEKEEKAKFKLESKEKLKDDKKDKSKDKEKDKAKDKEKEKVKEKEKEKVKDKEKDKGKEKEKEKTKDKEKEKSKEKEKEKVKEKDKDKTKKLTKMPSTITSGVPFEEIFTIGVALPIFGVPLHQSVERMPCHDQTRLPLVVRDSIDYLQEHGLTSPQIYRAEADKIKLQQLRTLYTDRGAIFPYHYDVAVACAMLKMFLGELPDSILTQELHSQFEQATALSEPQRSASIVSTLARLANTAPASHTVLSWLICHLAAVLSHEQVNHASIQTLTSALCPALNMSPSLLAYFILNAKTFFPNVELTKYVPPLQSVPAEWSEGAEAEQLASELRKQESLLGVLHAELLAGVHPHLDLWAAQRVVTQLKRQLRAMQKSAEPNNQPPQQQPSEEKQTEAEKSPNITETIPTNTKLETPKISKEEIRESPKPQEAVFDAEFEDNFQEETNPEISKEIENPQVTEISDKPKLSENELKKLRLELENAEYLQLKSLLQAKINSEQFEIVKLRSQVALKNKQENAKEKDNNTKDTYTPEEQELRQKLMKENATLEQKRMNLINQIFQERVACIQLKIELAMKELH